MSIFSETLVAMRKRHSMSQHDLAQAMGVSVSHVERLETDYITPDDIKAMVYDILRHRILLSYEAEAEDITTENLIADILEKLNLP